MAKSQTEIFQHSNFRSPKLECVNGELPLPAVVLLRFHTHCENTQSQTLESDQTTGEKRILQLQQTVAASASSCSFYIHRSLISPLLLSLTFFFFLLGLSHPFVTSLSRSSLPSFPLLLFSSSSGRAKRLEEESLFSSGIKLLQGIKCNGD